MQARRHEGEGKETIGKKGERDKDGEGGWERTRTWVPLFRRRESWVGWSARCAKRENGGSVRRLIADEQTNVATIGELVRARRNEGECSEAHGWTEEGPARERGEV